MDYQEYLKSGGYKIKRKDEFPKKSRRKVVADYKVKQPLAIWRDTSSESDESKKNKDFSMLAVEEISYNSLFALMEKSEDEEENKVTLFDIKKKLNNYSHKKITKLANVLLNYVCELIIQRDLLEHNVKI